MARPAFRFRNFIGHRRVVEPVIHEIRGAKARGLPAGHIIVIGLTLACGTEERRALPERVAADPVRDSGHRVYSLATTQTQEDRR